ncbi:MAG: hypothetical protein ACFE8C_10185 [Promethearchaeota archaeon]
MTEIESSNKIKRSSGSEQFEQIELLFEVYKLRENRKKLREKLKSFEKMIKSDINKDITKKVGAFRIVSAGNNEKFKEFMSRINPSYNIFKLLKDQRDNRCFLRNLEEAKKKKKVDLQQYEVTKGYYLQKLLEINNSIDHLKEVAISYYRELEDNLILFEDQRIKLTIEKLRKKITKEEFHQKSQELESLKHQLEEKLAFLEVEIIEKELD